MCGIGGAFNKNGFKFSNLLRMSSLIDHRGPDGAGFFYFDKSRTLNEDYSTDGTNSIQNKLRNWEDTYKEMNVYLGFIHRRLSILDLSENGRQPFSDKGKRYWITYNGEIYNYLEIRQELISKGIQFYTDTDTEVLLNSLIYWGKACLDRFIGMWAFAFFDSQTGDILLCRDRYGIKPLYYWISDDSTFYFGSEIKQFTAVDNWTAILNREKAADYLLFSGLTDHTSETLFKDVYNLSPGSFLEINIFYDKSDQEYCDRVVKWYKPTIVSFTGGFKEAVETFKDKLIDSVRLHLRADVKVGSALSGGLDSSSIVSIINRILRETDNEVLQNTFSSVHEDEKYSEKKWIDEVVNSMNIDAHYVYPSPDHMLYNLEHLVWTMDEPYHSQSAYLGYEVFKKARKENTIVLLNGQGADEYLSGYGAFRILRQSKIGIKRLFFEVKLTSASNNFFAILSEVLKIKCKGLYLQSSYRIKNLLFKFRGSILRLKQVINFDILEVDAKYPFSSESVQFKSHIDISLFQLFSDALPRYLRWEDRNSMANSVEARVPFLDHRLVEFCHSLPITFLDSPEISKLMLFESMKGVLPESVRNRKDKKGFLTPEERWLKQDFTESFKKLMKESIDHSNGIINESAINYLNEMANGKLPFDFSYWRLIIFGIWMKVFKVKL